MTQLDSDFLQVSLGEVGQHIGIDCIVDERGCIFAKAKLFQPLRDVIGHLGDSLPRNIGQFVCDASESRHPSIEAPKVCYGAFAARSHPIT